MMKRVIISSISIVSCCVTMKAPQGTVPGIAKGLAKGHVVTRRTMKERPSQRKGRSGARINLVRSVVRSVAGYAPYEKRAIELIKGGGVNSQKRAMRFCKKRVCHSITITNTNTIIIPSPTLAPSPSPTLAPSSSLSPSPSLFFSLVR